MNDTDQISELLDALDSDILDDRVRAIQILGEVGDERALRVLRRRLALANRELSALVVAVGRLKKRVGVK
jgi:HEAT repeat protein